MYICKKNFGKNWVFMSMKYIITENRINKLYFRLLNDLFGKVEEFENENYPDSRWWRNKEGVVMELDDMENKLYVLGPIFSYFGDILGLNDRDEILEIIRNWAEYTLDIDEINRMGTLGPEANGWGIYG